MTRVLESAPACRKSAENLIHQGVPTVVGAKLRVPLVTGEWVEYANLDHAASAPCLDVVRDRVNEFLPWYASVHRGAGFASQVSTKIYEQARAAVRGFVDARSSDAVVFTRNTTDALNLLARCMPPGTSIVVFDTEHHAALLPWDGPRVRRIPLPGTHAEAVSAVDQALATCPQGPRLVVVSGASNVTGELLPVAQIVAAARRHGARVALDAAQLCVHRRVSLRGLDVDYLAISGHKLYAPFGAGALIGRADWLRAAKPYLAGGGASKLVESRAEQVAVSWNLGPERHEAGSPNTIGAYALGVACAQLAEHAEAIAAKERDLLALLHEGLASVPGLTQLRFFDDQVERVGSTSFVLDGHDPGLVAAVLSAEYGIGVRDGAFCAHIATRHLIRRHSATGTQALRVSLGLGATPTHITRLIQALHAMVSAAPSWSYAIHNGRWMPIPDPRPQPAFLAPAP